MKPLQKGAVVLGFEYDGGVHWGRIDAAMREVLHWRRSIGVGSVSCKLKLR
jgi:hypothetical protein